MERIAIQGYPGAFHDIAARIYFGEKIEIVAADTFDEVVSLVEANEIADHGVMAIENSIAGSLMYNYNLINTSALEIVGEIYIKISQNLLALPGVQIDEITEVHSHPMAISQCKSFFVQYPHIKLVESRDTAESARMIRDNNDHQKGALASTLAAELYELHILKAGIETNKKNYTRFIILDHFMDAPKQNDFDKVSISFAVSHDSGSLYRALGTLANNGANMTKIQSAPILGRPWEYLFYVDFMMEEKDKYGAIIQDLSEHSKGLKIMGRYKSGKQHEI